MSGIVDGVNTYPLVLFVPASFVPGQVIAAGDLAGVLPGSAIVGVPGTPPYVEVAFEGNVYGAVNLTRFVERAASAAWRLWTDAPTVARRTVSPASLVSVGVYRTNGEIVLPEGGERRLRSWLQTQGEPVPVSDLVLR